MLGKQLTKRIRWVKEKKILNVFFTSTLFSAIWKTRGKYCIYLRKIFCDSGRKWQIYANLQQEKAYLNEHTLFKLKSHYYFSSISPNIGLFFFFSSRLQTTVKKTNYSIIVLAISSYLYRSRGQIQKEEIF